MDREVVPSSERNGTRGEAARADAPGTGRFRACRSAIPSPATAVRERRLRRGREPDGPLRVEVGGADAMACRVGAALREHGAGHRGRRGVPRIGRRDHGEIPKRLNGADCKSAGLWPTEVRILLSPPPVAGRETQAVGPGVRGGAGFRAGIAQLARAPAFQAGGRGFESRFPLQNREPRIEGRAARFSSRSSGGRARPW